MTASFPSAPPSVRMRIPRISTMKNYGVGADGKRTFKAGTKMGVWNYIEKIDGTDHINMVGQTQKSTHAMLQANSLSWPRCFNSIPVSSSSDAHILPGRALHGYAGLYRLVARRS